MNSTSTDQRLQIEKPMCSDRIEKIRLRRATFFPVDSQKSRASRRRSWTHLPDGGPPASGSVVAVVVAVTLMLVLPSPGDRGVAATGVGRGRGSTVAVFAVRHCRYRDGTLASPSGKRRCEVRTGRAS